MIKMLQFVILGIIIYIGSAVNVRAADSVGLSAMVVERKSYNTINDFNFSSMGQNTEVINQEGQIAGASTATANQSNLNTIAIILSIFFASVFIFVLRKIKIAIAKRIKSNNIELSTKIA